MAREANRSAIGNIAYHYLIDEWVIIVAVRFSILIAAPLFAQADAEFFESRVRPVLAKNCYACHGAKKQFNGLRVDSREALLQGGKRGAAMLPGAPGESLIVRAIRREPGVTAMPAGSKLAAGEIASIEEWIRRGATWPTGNAPAAEVADWYERAAGTHWSFQPVKAPALPAVRNAAWPRNEIDRFILAGLEAKGLTPAPPANPQTFARRLSLMLTGLPAEGDVDRLLGSPHFGEQWARHWMDVMRYGETRGYEWNYEVVGAWRYRDYLIRAFNADVPFDRLVREHVAGDLLDQPRTNARERLNESVIGTTFFRLGEAGHDDCIKFRELSLDVVDNQIDTLGKAFQGLTLSCARCHNHKLDPIPTADYYGLFGILNSSRAVTHTIDLPQPFPDADALKRGIRVELTRLWTQQLDTLRPDAKKAACDDPVFPWLAMRNTAPERFAEVWRELAARYKDEGAAREQFNRASFTPYLDWSAWSMGGLGLRMARSGDFAPATEGERVLTSIVPAGLHTNLYTDRWNGTLRSPLLPKTHKYVSLRLMGGRLASRRTVLDNCAIGEGYKPLQNDSPVWHRLDTIAVEKLPAFIEVITKADNPRIPDRPGVLKETPDELASPRSYFGAMRAVLHDTAETPREELSHLARLFDGPAPASLDELATRYRKLAKQALAGQTDGDVRWLDSFLRHGMFSNDRNASPKLAELVAAYRALEAKLPAPRVVDGLADAGAGFDAPILITGDPHSPGAIAPRHFLSRIGHTKSAAFGAAGSGRRELAEVLASPANPLTARVMVNRVWHHMFGRGLVATVDNFGREGERPTHPALLDYLAARFIEEGWSVKKLVRTIVESRTFQQASVSNKSAQDVDPRNTLLHHFPARRLPAEGVRDSILHTSGRLDRTLYGPSIAPPRDNPQDYRRLFGGPLDGAGRRSIYTQVTRMEGSRFLEIFDYPSPMAARGARDVTNVPAQALALMNDPFVMDQAQVWAERLVHDGAMSVESRVNSMFQLALNREASPVERLRFAGLAAELASLHKAPSDRVLAATAVWRDLAHTIFNLKEFVYIQ